MRPKETPPEFDYSSFYWENWCWETAALWWRFKRSSRTCLRTPFQEETELLPYFNLRFVCGSLEDPLNGK
jgi:hypothetical protein